MIRLVAFDLDGTVLNEVGEISGASVETMRELIRRGIGVASASGRNVEKSQAPFAGAPDLADAMYIVGYNGALALGPSAEGRRPLLHEERMPADAFREAIGYIGDRGLNLVYCRCEIGENGVREAYITDRETGSIRALAAQTGISFVFDSGLLARLSAGDLGPPPKLMVLPGKGRRDAVLQEMRRTFDGRLYLARTGEDRIEAMHPEVNKGAPLPAAKPLVRRCRPSNSCCLGQPACPARG